MRTRTGEGLGLGLALLSAATFGTSGVFATSLVDAGWTPAAAVTARLSIAALALTAPALVALRGRWDRLRGHAGTLVTYGLVAVAGCQFAYFSAVSHLDVGVALLLEYLGSLGVVAWLWLRHGRRPRRLTLLGAAVTVVGLALVLGVAGPAAGAVRLDPVGVAWGLVAAAGLTTFFVLSAGPAQASREPLPGVVVAWAGMVVGAVALAVLELAHLLPVRAATTPVLLAGHRVSWVVPVLGLSLVAAAFAYVAGIGAARLLGATLSAFAGLTEVCFAVVFAWLALGQLPAAAQVAGGAAVLAGIALVRWDELRPRSAAAPAGRTSPAGALD